MGSYLVSETQIVFVNWTVEADSEEEARERFLNDHETLTEISRDVQDSQGLTITARTPNVIVWTAPYNPDDPHDALGVFFPSHAAQSIGCDLATMLTALNETGAYEANGMHVEFDA